MLMLLNESVFNNMPVGSVRSSGRIGLVTGTVINPHNLHIDALRCRVARGEEQLLMPIDIRDLSPVGVVINDYENLLDIADAIRLEPILKLNFKLMDKTAFIGKRKVGKVDGYAINTESLFIQKIYVRPGIISRMNKDQLTFDRSSIKEVTDTKIVFNASSKVRDTVASSVEHLTKMAMPQPSANASFTSENE